MVQRQPRGLIVSTGEATPRGESLRGRMLVIEVRKEPADMNWRKLSECQRAARRGEYARGLSGFLQWLAPDYADLSGRLRDLVEEFRGAAYSGPQNLDQAIS